MIVSNRFVRTYLFGSKVAGIHNKSFQCCVSTAKEGLFQKQSTIILEPKIGDTVGARAAGLRPCGKVIYSSSLRTSARFQFHDVIAKTLDALGEEGSTLEQAIERIFADLKRRGIAAETINLAVDQGQADAQFNPGGLNINDEDVPHDDFTREAASCRKLAEQGDADAQLSLGFRHHNGQGVPKDYAQAAFWYRKSAEQGFAEAQYNLAFLYYKGQGVPKDYTKAAFWVRKAAEQGVAVAQNNLAGLYRDGQGVSKDYVQAASWYRKAAEHGVAEAQSNLGAMYRFGQGVPRDYAQAVFWSRKAAEQGDAMAQAGLGILHGAGLGVPEDIAEAYFWFDLAAAGKLDTSDSKQVAKYRDQAASILTPADLSREQERARKWLEAHQAKPQ